MALWIQDAVSVVRRGDREYSDWSPERHDQAAGHYGAMASGYSGGIRADLETLAAGHREAAKRKRLAVSDLFGSAA